MLPSPRFSVASAFVPHLCFLSLLCYVRILLAPFHCPFSLLSLLTPFLCLLGVLFCSVFLISLIYSVTSVFSNFPVFPASSVSLLSLFTLFSLLFPQTLPCVLKRFSLTISRKMNTMCAKNVLTRTPGHTNPDVLTLTPSSGIPSARQARAVAGSWRHGRP